MSDIKLFSTGKSGTREFSVKYVHTVRYLQTRIDKGLATGLRKGREFDFEELREGLREGWKREGRSNISLWDWGFCKNEVL